MREIAVLPDSFAKHPKSVSEIRADQDGNASRWTPRDVLISVLRQIDEGEIKPETLIVCFTDTKDMPNGLPSICWEVASKGILPTIGLLTRVAHRVNASHDQITQTEP